MVDNLATICYNRITSKIGWFMASSVIKRYLKGFSKVLLLLILFVFTTSTCFASELDDKRAELDKIEHQIYEINKNLESIQGQRKTLESQIAAMNQ